MSEQFQGPQSYELIGGSFILGLRRMRSRGLAEDEGSDSDSKNGCEHRDNRLSDRRKIPALQYWSNHHATGVRGRLRFDPFPAKTRLRASEAQGLSGEEVKV